MKREIFVRPKERWNPAFLHKFIGVHPGLTSTQITALLLTEHYFKKSVSEVHAMIYVLRKQKKVVVTGKGGTKGGMIYESV